MSRRRRTAHRTRYDTIRRTCRIALALFFAAAGYAHLTWPQPFLSITPGWVPASEMVIFWTGIAEFAGAIGLLQPLSPRMRQAAGAGLAAYTLLVWPANVHHFAMDMARADGGLGLVYHMPRMMAQPALIWLALWTGGVTNWPFRRR